MTANNRLKAMFSLKSKITVYIPATVNINETIDNTEFVNKAATLLSECFGGATSTEALGYWVSDTAGLVKENTTMVFAYAGEDDLKKNLDKVIDFCENLKIEMSQDAVALELNGEWKVTNFLIEKQNKKCKMVLTVKRNNGII